MYRIIFSVISLFALGMSAQANNQQEIEAILAQEDGPFGVVFEIVEDGDSALQWAIPAVNAYVRQLRKRFPDIGIAVVSHGKEQFGLMASHEEETPQLHAAVKSLVANDVPVHVCGTHASWQGQTAADFPDYVDVTPAGPTAIRNYEAMGYVLIEIEKPQSVEIQSKN